MVDRAHRWQVIFDDVDEPDDGWDSLDEDERLALVGDVFGLAGALAAAHVALVKQLLGGDPPFVWDTLARVLDDGLPAETALGQLRMVLLSVIHDALDGSPFDESVYRQRLSALPSPTVAAIEEAIDRLAAAQPVSPTDELVDAVVLDLDSETDDLVLRSLVEQVIEALIEGFGPLRWLSGGRTVHRRSLTAGIVLVHDLTEAEQRSGRLEVDVDLAGFAGTTRPTVEGADGSRHDLVVLGDGRWRVVWQGPEGWLEEHPVGSVIAVRVSPGEEVSIEALAERPPVGPAVIELLRRVVEAEVDEPEMPVEATDVVLAMLAEDPDVFRLPQAPLGDLCVAAGLERRGSEVGDDPELWRNAADLRRYGRLLAHTDHDHELTRSVVKVLRVCEQLALGEPPEPDDVTIALDSLAEDDDVFELVSRELFHYDADPTPTPEVFATLIQVASGRARTAVRTLAAVGAERAGDLLTAEAHLEKAVAEDPSHAAAADRLAWYASDRGDAAKAARLWAQVDGSSAGAMLLVLEPFTRPRGPSRGRNQPCWCGSGRKYKHCHLGTPDRAPLSDRVGWLYRKAISYVERQGSDAWADAYEVAQALSGHEPESFEEVFDVPVVVDLLLTEGGWFEGFLADRGPLLPDDEALLAASWLAVDRSVYEIEEVRPGKMARVRDLRSGEMVEVREPSFSREAHPGMLVCARALPDGAGTRFFGPVLTVPVGQEAQVLDLLDDGEPTAIATWVTSLSRPELRTRVAHP